MKVMPARKQRSGIFQVLKENSYDSRIIYPAKVFFINERQNKYFSN